MIPGNFDYVRRSRAPRVQMAAPQPVLGKDPICGTTVDTSTARHILERDGVKHYFCCAGCKEKFAHAV